MVRSISFLVRSTCHERGCRRSPLHGSSIAAVEKLSGSGINDRCYEITQTKSTGTIFLKSLMYISTSATLGTVRDAPHDAKRPTLICQLTVHRLTGTTRGWRSQDDVECLYRVKVRRLRRMLGTISAIEKYEKPQQHSPTSDDTVVRGAPWLDVWAVLRLFCGIVPTLPSCTYILRTVRSKVGRPTHAYCGTAMCCDHV